MDNKSLTSEIMPLRSISNAWVRPVGSAQVGVGVQLSDDCD